MNITITDNRPRWARQTHIGLDFVDSNGARRTSYQLLNPDGRAIATAEFRDLKCERFHYTSLTYDEARSWHDYLVLRHHIA